MYGIAESGPLDVQQSQQGRRDLNQALKGTPVAQRRHGRGVTFMQGDWADPQIFTNHPVIKQTIEQTNIGTDTSWPGLPGRPPISWDGEPGATSPAGQ